MRIKDIPLENRPRERFVKFGPESLSDAELLALILQKGTFKENVVDLSNRLISNFGLDKLFSVSFKELQSIKGVGPAKAMQILAIFSLVKRVQIKSVDNKPLICAEDVFRYAAPKIGDKDREHFMVILLDSKNRVIADSIVSIGILNKAISHSREIFKDAIRHSANSIILVHNHPSGDVESSDEDVFVTEQIKDSGEILGIKVLDHVIVSRNGFKSVK